MRVDNFSESLWCNIRCGKESTVLGVCYRAPDSRVSNDEKMYELIDEVSKGEIVVMGKISVLQSWIGVN